jgi:hypothetical protein
LHDFLQELPYNNEKRMIIQQWSKRNISGESASYYFLEIIKSVFANKNKPEAPWLKN